MAKVRGYLLHPHGLADSDAEAKWLVDRRGCDERVINPEADSVGHQRVALGEEVIELISLKS